ncbi:uncharacterized protein LOC116252079 [Nymphaea colorata]|nr:uncharacterized protein LOC116252079 [Nymphaea colorata]
MDQGVVPSAATDYRPYLVGKSVEELRHALLCTTLELEYTRNTAKEEMEKHEQQAREMLQLLKQACRERDEAKDRCRDLLEKLLLASSTNTPGTAEVFTNVDPKRVDSTTSECDSLSRASSSTAHSGFGFDLSDDHRRVSPPPPPTPPMAEPTSTKGKLASTWCDIWPETGARLPEKGKLLQAVVDAGPLLQTLLLAGPLPQWRHPPPPLTSFQIPPVDVCMSTGALTTEGLLSMPRVRSSDCRYSGPGDRDAANEYRRVH